MVLSLILLWRGGETIFSSSWLEFFFFQSLKTSFGTVVPTCVCVCVLVVPQVLSTSLSVPTYSRLHAEELLAAVRTAVTQGLSESQVRKAQRRSTLTFHPSTFSLWRNASVKIPFLLLAICLCPRVPKILTLLLPSFRMPGAECPGLPHKRDSGSVVHQYSGHCSAPRTSFDTEHCWCERGNILFGHQCR